MNAPLSIFWFRQDLRLADQPGLQDGGRWLPVYIWSPEDERPWAPGTASRWWLHHSLQDLATNLRGRRSRLILRAGPAEMALRRLIRESGARRLVFNRRREPAARARDERLAKRLQASGVQVDLHDADAMFVPDRLLSGSGSPYQVFTAFWRAALAGPEPAAPIPAPGRLSGPARWPASLPLEALNLLTRPDRAGGWRLNWRPGETGAARALQAFLRRGLAGYPENRDWPAREGTSRLSPHLHFGELSPCRVWHAVTRRAAAGGFPGILRAADAFLRQLGWREFSLYLLHHFPHTPEAPLRPAFRSFPWNRDPRGLEAWQRGRTGYPLVDAGLRQLWETGWMHNRVRMVVASFLVKDLGISWQEGARWFWETLVDADLASNTLGWQWAAGCGADAAPYFRVFNPLLQGERFDPDGRYRRRWLPELPGPDNPRTIVDHAEARQQALIRFAHFRRSQL